MKSDFDIAIIGSGFAGSLMAMVARRLGRSVILIERGRHPRFVIGESSTPLANLLLEELAVQYDLPAVLPLSRWGTWQRSHPGIGCGLKRGFTFFHHERARAFPPDPDRRRQLLVAASPHDAISDTHWYRPDFDQFLLEEARRLGAEYLDQAKIETLHFETDGARFEVRQGNRTVRFGAGWVIDASGPRGCLHRMLGIEETAFSGFPDTQAVYSHFTGVRRLSELSLIDGVPPYPVDDAAVHHVFDGGWIWVLRFNNGLVSAGVAAVDSLARSLGFNEGAPAWNRLISELPAVQDQFRDSEARLPFVHAPRLAFRTSRMAGSRWVLLPSAAGFVDPLLSTGFPLTLLGIHRLASLLKESGDTAGLNRGIAEYARMTLDELDATARLVGALYATMSDFDLFRKLSLLYFAAASYSESARRLGKTAGGFLLHDHPAFGPATRHCCLLALRAATLRPRERGDLIDSIHRTIEGFDVAGLSNPARKNWHPVNIQDLLEAAGKLGASRAEIEAMLRRTGAWPESGDAFQTPRFAESRFRMDPLDRAVP